MRWIKWGVILVISLAGSGFIGFKLFERQIATALFEGMIERRIAVNDDDPLQDGLHIYLCGAGSPMPDTSRAGPCLGVQAGTRTFVFDIGSGGARNLGSMNFPFETLQAVYLTHLHSDHIDGLGELLLLSWIGGTRSDPTPVYGPRGTERVVAGFNMAYQTDATYRTAHHGPVIADPEGFGGQATEITLPAGPAGEAIVFQDELLKITALRVEHAPVEPAFGYRIDYKDRSVSISGDTIYHPGFVAASEGVDLMLHEALDPDMVSTIGARLAQIGQANRAKIFSDILDYHASPEDAARSAQEAGATELVLYHLVPPLPNRLAESVFLGEARGEFDGPLTIGSDGLLISLPTGSEKITKTQIF